MRAYLFDLDGTVCNIDHRLHFINLASNTPEVIAAGGWKADWDGFYAACVGDAPIEPICELVRALAHDNTIIFVSGRSDIVKPQTRAWLRTTVLPSLSRALLYMRKDGDHRPDHVVKGEMLDEILAAGYQPIMAFEDRAQVVKMWRERGIVCAQVAEGDF